MIIDCHAHIGKAIILEYWWVIDASVERILKLEEKAGVDKVVVFPVHYPPDKYPEANKEVANAATRYPDKIIPFAKVAASHPEAHEHLLEAVEQYGVKGLKLHATEGFPTREIMNILLDHGLPLIIHTDDSKGPFQLVPLIRAYPDVTIIIAHLGSYIFNYYHQLQAIYLASRYDNVYLDTSVGSSLHRNLVRAIEEAGAEKILFGSDAPEFHPAVERRKIEILDISDKEKRMILGENIRRILKI
ncbi:MAG: hypothetical protein DRJ66_02030 [Thermoprotei archaeon]|nr:MAG: hypothetical protein DRJ66_02030 [Thermoprotei archaeon]RLF20089.1 MAG: hypothetical protein DRZ82_03545 [Thermoprotei archaeon]